MEITINSTKTGKLSLFVKSMIIAGMAVFLWIPTNLILDLVRERESRQREAVADISNKWAGKQTLTAPVLAIPYYTVSTDNRTGKSITVRDHLFIMPDKLEAETILSPETRYRGIYEVGVYKSKINLSGNFKGLKPEDLNISSATILWNEAKILFNLTDPTRGINDDLFINWDNNKNVFNTEFSGAENLAFSQAAPLKFSPEEMAKDHSFTMQVSLNGSSQFMITPLARENKMTMRSSWKDPGFTGIKLPDTREVTDSGFIASWKFINRNSLVQHDNTMDLSKTTIGVQLLIPVDNYNKTERSVKYALLCIMLTFAAFFLIETIYKRSLHLVQYGLAGLALVLFYTLLLSISEYTGFDWAYLIAGVSTIGLITWFIGSILHSSRLAMFVCLVLSVVYSYIYTLIQLEDYSLLMGSIGLFLALAIIMFFSRKLEWDNPHHVKENLVATD